MTSAPNHRQLLNGNSGLVLLFSLVLILSSCGMFKKVDDKKTATKDDYELDEIEGKRKYNPQTGRYEYDTNVTEKMDTVAWKESRVGEAPPITSSTKPDRPGTDVPSGTIDPGTGNINTVNVESPKLFSYNVAILLPFLTNQFDAFSQSLPKNSSWAINFYGGIKMALGQLDREGVHLQVRVLDTKASESETMQLLTRSELIDANMILGPYRQRNVQKVAEFAMEKEIPMISPYSASMSVTENNPYYIQLNPSLRTHCAAITKHIRKKYSADKVVLLCRENNAEKAALEYFQEANYELEGTSNTRRFQEYILADGSADYINEADFSTYIKEDSTTVFVVPSWQDESFVYNVLRKINLDKGLNNVVVYGMPQWMSFERIAPDYFENLQVHISSASFIDMQTAPAKAFRKDYYDKYGTIPSIEAYIGFDSMLYFGRMIHKYGKKFQYFIDRDRDKYLHTTFNFEPVASPGAQGEDYSKIDRFENKFVNILKFEDFRFSLSE